MRTPKNLYPLCAFGGAARCLCGVAASAKLRVAPQAVGQWLRGLEDCLRVALFPGSWSGPARLVVTEAGRTIASKRQMGFDYLMSMDRGLRTESSHEVSSRNVSCAPASKWLLLRAQRFQNWHLYCAPFADTTYCVPNRAHLCVQYARGQKPAWEPNFLPDDAVFSACHLSQVAKDLTSWRIKDLQTVPLIHDISMAPETGASNRCTWLRPVYIYGINIERRLGTSKGLAVTAEEIVETGAFAHRSTLAANNFAAGGLLQTWAVHRARSSATSRFINRCTARATVVALRDWLVAKASEAT